MKQKQQKWALKVGTAVLLVARAVLLVARAVPSL